MMDRLDLAGHKLVEAPEDADVVVVNTCGFIQTAKEEAIAHIIEMGMLKRSGTIRGLVAAGCLVERYREVVQSEMPEVDALLGGGSIESVAEAVEAAFLGKPYARFDSIVEASMGGGRILSTPFYTAYLKIGDGCDNRCSYCAIPSIRGRFRSRPMEELVEEAGALSKAGVREIVLVSQDTTRYGEDLYGENRLCELLSALEEVPGIVWIRTLYAYPDKITDELIALIAKSKKVVRAIDIPMQHSCDEILRAMNRRGDRAMLESTITRLREAMPDICIRTTFICGFPGETDAQFEELCSFMMQHRLDRVGCLAYSAEEGTPAALMSGQASESVKQSRVDALMLLQNRISSDINAQFIGRRLTILVEGFDEQQGCMVGRSYRDAPEIDGHVYFSTDRETSAGDFVEVEITDADDYDLYGVVEA